MKQLTVIYGQLVSAKIVFNAARTRLDVEAFESDRAELIAEFESVYMQLNALTQRIARKVEI